MYIVSFDKVLRMTIHNQYLNLELTSLVCFSDGAIYCVSLSQQTDTSDIVETSFGIDLKQRDLKCVSLYKLQRKHATKTDNQSDNSAASSEDTAKDMYLLVAWVTKDYKHEFYTHLMEFTDDFTWDEDKLWVLYKEYNDQFRMDDTCSTITWLMHGNAVIKMVFDITYGSDYKLDIIMSEGNKEDDMKEPMKIDPKRLVLSLYIFIMLIYTVRLTIPPSFKLNIHNQCTNVDLVSPTYFISEELEFHKPPNYNVCTNDIMRFVFIIKWSRESYGVLIYKLQRKQPNEYAKINEDTSNATYLLVVWEVSESKELCADILLVEHSKGFDWGKDILEELYCKNSSRFRLCPDSVTEKWSLNDNIALITTFKIMDEDHTLDITVSEAERYDGMRMPACIELER
jgi:hypothetical protein